MHLLSCFSRVRLFSTLWTATHQAPLSTGFSRQEYWSGLPFPSPGDIPDKGIKSSSLVSLMSQLAYGFFTAEPPWKPYLYPSVQSSRSVVSNSLLSHGLQHTRLPYPYQLPELAETNGHRIGDAIQPSHPLSSPSLPAFNHSQHPGLSQ